MGKRVSNARGKPSKNKGRHRRRPALPAKNAYINAAIAAPPKPKPAPPPRLGRWARLKNWIRRMT